MMADLCEADLAGGVGDGPGSSLLTSQVLPLQRETTDGCSEARQWSCDGLVCDAVSPVHCYLCNALSCPNTQMSQPLLHVHYKYPLTQADCNPGQHTVAWFWIS